MWNAEDRQVVGHGETTKGLEMALASRSLITSPQGGGGAGDYRRLGETDPGAPGCYLLCPAWTPASKPDGGATCMFRSRVVLQGELSEFSPAPSPRASLILQALRLPSHLQPHPLPCADRSLGCA